MLVENSVIDTLWCFVVPNWPKFAAGCHEFHKGPRSLSKSWSVVGVLRAERVGFYRCDESLVDSPWKQIEAGRF